MTRSWILLLFLAGCAPAAPEPPQPPAPVPAPPGAFDPSRCGTLEGTVRWEGDLPEVADFRAPVVPGLQRGDRPLQTWPHPHRPRVDGATHGVACAVVFLRGIDPARAKPWDHPPVRVELFDHRLEIVQGTRRGPRGIVRQGDSVEMVARGKDYHSLQLRGAAFFTQAFPEPNLVRRRALTQPGFVHLSSGCGYFWMSGHLLVSEHPYAAITDDEGRFRLEEVPAGTYEVVCWLPNWNVVDRELDGDTARVFRLIWAAPLEWVQKQCVVTGETAPVDFAVTASQVFSPQRHRGHREDRE